jgi:micrococcal nuclease
VRIVRDPSQGEYDKYDRLLAYLYTPDGTFLNRALIANGFAHEYTYHTPYQFQSEFKSAEASARTQHLGLWAQGVCP